MPSWLVLATALIGLISAAITGNGSVSEEQQAALNEQVPGFGSALASATESVNGLAPSYTSWAAQQSAANGLGLGNPFGQPTGLAENVSNFLADINIWWLIGLAAAAFLFLRGR